MLDPIPELEALVISLPNSLGFKAILLPPTAPIPELSFYFLLFSLLLTV